MNRNTFEEVIFRHHTVQCQRIPLFSPSGNTHPCIQHRIFKLRLTKCHKLHLWLPAGISEPRSNLFHATLTALLGLLTSPAPATDSSNSAIAVGSRRSWSTFPLMSPSVPCCPCCPLAVPCYPMLSTTVPTTSRQTPLIPAVPLLQTEFEHVLKRLSEASDVGESVAHVDQLIKEHAALQKRCLVGHSGRRKSLRALGCVVSFCLETVVDEDCRCVEHCDPVSLVISLARWTQSASYTVCVCECVQAGMILRPVQCSC